MLIHYNKSQQVSQLSTCLRYSFNYKRHEHTFCHHFDIETFRGVQGSTTWHRMNFKWKTLISHRLRGHAMPDLFLLKSETAARVV